MPRVKGGFVTRRRHKKILKMTKGFTGSKNRIFRRANEAILKALSYAYRDRRARKREMRALWIVRINAAARGEGLSYSRLMNGLKKAGVEVNRKMLADLAVKDLRGFEELVRVAKGSLS